MRIRPVLWQRRQTRGGFTLVEMAFAFAIIGIMSLMMIPRIQRSMQAHQTRRAAIQVAGDAERAFTLAGRYRKPMRLSCVVTAGVCRNAIYTIADRTGGTVRMTRDLKNGGDLGTMTVRFSVTPIDIFPSGVSTAADTIVVSSGTSIRKVYVTTAGQVRILP